MYDSLRWRWQKVMAAGLAETGRNWHRPSCHLVALSGFCLSETRLEAAQPSLADKMDDIAKLELLSLTNTVTQELVNHIGINDKTLAEFLISLHEECKSLDEFRTKLKAAGADLPESFIVNFDRLVLSMHPKYKKKVVAAADGAKEDKAAAESGVDDAEKERQRRLFPGLSLKDKEWEPSFNPAGDDANGKPIAPGLEREVDDLMNEFDRVAKKRQGGFRDDASPKRARRDSGSPPRSRRRSPDYDSKGRSYEDDRRARGRPPPPDQQPQLYKIYDGMITGIKDFGAFVTLEGVMGRAEGKSFVSLHLG
jgi:ATP-dependent RNA helicase DHX8/PRP22